MKILIVDDNRESLYLLETNLRGSGYETVSAANGKEALEKLQTEDYDMIISDILMPVMDGFQLCLHCKSDEKLKVIPFVFYTATYTDVRDEELASTIGVDRYIRKPVEPDEFITIIQSILIDMGKGEIAPKKPEAIDEKQVLKLYDERLVKKLEEKLLELEEEVARRRKLEQELKKHQDHLESMVKERTAELETTLEQLHKSEQNFRNSLDDSPLGIRIVGADGQTLHANRAILDIYGYDSIEELEATPRKKRYTAESYAEHQIRKEKRRRGEYVPSNYEISIVRKDGEIRYLQAFRKEVLWNGETQFQMLYHDITERKQMGEERLKFEKLESIGSLAGGIAHDFNNILTGILGNITLAERHLEPGGKAAERLLEAKKASLRAKDLTQQLLTFARGGAPIKQIASIANLLEESATFALRGSKVKCEFSLPDELWAVEVDEGQINQVITNIVINADEAMPAGGMLNIGAKNTVIKGGGTLPLPKGNYVEITIKDCGVGIPKEHLGRIFEPYFTTKQRGSGLGLSTTYSIIKSHDGYITVESELGVGTTFYIYLPASKEPTPIRKRGETSTSRLPGQRKNPGNG